MSKPIQTDRIQTGDLGKEIIDQVTTSELKERNTTDPRARQNGKLIPEKKKRGVIDHADSVDPQMNGQHGSRKRRGSRTKKNDNFQIRPNEDKSDNRHKRDRSIRDRNLSTSPRATTQGTGHGPVGGTIRPNDRHITQNVHSMPDGDKLPSVSQKSNNNNSTFKSNNEDSFKYNKNSPGPATMDEEGETELQRKWAAAKALSEMATGLFISTDTERHTTAPPPPPPPPPPHPTTPPTERGFPGHSPPPPPGCSGGDGAGGAVGSGARMPRVHVAGGDGLDTVRTSEQGVLVIAGTEPSSSSAPASSEEARALHRASTLALEGRREAGEGRKAGGRVVMVGEGPSGPDMENKAPLTYQFYHTTTTTPRLPPAPLPPPPPPPTAGQHHRFHITSYPHPPPPHQYLPVHTGKSPLHSPSTTLPAADPTSARRVTELDRHQPWVVEEEAQILASAHQTRAGVIEVRGHGEEAIGSTQNASHRDMNPASVLMHRTTGGVIYRVHERKTEHPDQHHLARVHPTTLSPYSRDVPEEAQNLCMRDMVRTSSTSTASPNPEIRDVPKSLPLKKRKYVTEESADVLESPSDSKSLPKQRYQWGSSQINHSPTKVITGEVNGRVGHLNDMPVSSLTGYQRPLRQHTAMDLRGLEPHYVTSTITNGGLSLTSGHRMVSPTEQQRTDLPLDFSSASNRTLQAATTSHTVSQPIAPMTASVNRTVESVSSNSLNEMRNMSALSHIVNKLSAQHDRKFGSEEFGAQLRKMAAAAAAFASGGSSGPPQQRMSFRRMPTPKQPQPLSPITPPVSARPFLPPSLAIPVTAKDTNHHAHLKRKGSSRPHEKQKVFIGTQRMHTDAMSGRSAGRDGSWHPDGGGRVHFVTSDVNPSMKQPQPIIGGRAGSLSSEQAESVTKKRAGIAAGGGAGVEAETQSPSVTEAEAANPGAGAAEVKEEELSPSEVLRINPQDSLRMLRECSLAVRPDEDGDLPLHVAVVQGNIKTIHKLIQLMALKKVTIDYCNLLRQTPLHLAVITRQPDIVHKLLGCGASPNYTDRVGNTSVHLAVRHQTLPCLNVIINHAQRKPNLNQKNFEGLAPLHLAVQIQDDTLTEAELVSQKMDIMKTLLVSGAETDITDGKSGRTPLHHAVETRQIKLVEMLLEHHSKVNVQSYAGNTALHTASERNYKNIMTLLMHHGADTTIKNANHETYNSVSKEIKPPVMSREASFSQSSPSIRIPKVENMEEINPSNTAKLGPKRGRLLRLKSLDSPPVTSPNVRLLSPGVLQHVQSTELFGTHSPIACPSTETIGHRTISSSPNKGNNSSHIIKSEGQDNQTHGSMQEGRIVWAHSNAPIVRDQPGVKSEHPDTLSHAAPVQDKSPLGSNPAISYSVSSQEIIGSHKIPPSSPKDSQQASPRLPAMSVGQMVDDRGVVRHYGSSAHISSLTSMVNHLQRVDEPMKAPKAQQTLSQTSTDPQPRKVRVAGTVYLPQKAMPVHGAESEADTLRRTIEDVVKNHSGLSLQHLEGGMHKVPSANNENNMMSLDSKVDSEVSYDVSGPQHKMNNRPKPTHTNKDEVQQSAKVSLKENDMHHSEYILTNTTEPTEQSVKETHISPPPPTYVGADKPEIKADNTAKPQSIDEVMTEIIDKAGLRELRQKDEGAKNNKDGVLQEERCEAVDGTQKEVSVSKLPVEIKVTNSANATLPTDDKCSGVTSLRKHQSPGTEKTASALPSVPESPDIFPRLVICETEEASAGHGKKRRKIDEIGTMLASSPQKKISSSTLPPGETDEQKDKLNTNFESKADGVKQSETEESTTAPAVTDSNPNAADCDQMEAGETVLNEFTGQLVVKPKSVGSEGSTEQDELVEDSAQLSPDSTTPSHDKS